MQKPYYVPDQELDSLVSDCKKKWRRVARNSCYGSGRPSAGLNARAVINLLPLQMLNTIQVLRYHLLELEKVSSSCFCVPRVGGARVNRCSEYTVGGHRPKRSASVAKLKAPR